MMLLGIFIEIETKMHKSNSARKLLCGQLSDYFMEHLLFLSKHTEYAMNI